MSKLYFSLIVVFSALIGVATTAPDRTQEKPPIPPDLYFKFTAVPSEDNAIINWRRAAAVEVPLEEHLAEKITYCWIPSASKPSEEDLDALRSWVRRDKEALEFFDASLRKPKAQWPEQDPYNKQPELYAMAHLTRARLFEADSLAEEKKFPVAVDSLEKSLKLTQLGIEGDAAFIQYLLSSRMRTMVQGAMLRLAARRDLPMPLLERLLKDLPPLDSETNTYDRVLRVEFTRYGYRTTDVRRLAEAWSKISETNDALLFYPENLRRPFKVLLDPSLVAVHPKPLDEIVQLNKDIRYLRIFRTNSVSAWTNRSEVVQDECAETIERLEEEIKPLMELVKDEPLPLSKQAADRARPAYLRIKNPIGRMFAGSILDLVESESRVFRCRTEREAARAILGLLIFERREGILPEKLSDVVDAKILESVPFDPFGNAPISYSRDRRIVWSVGQDGVNDNGKSDDKLHWFTGDAVWHVPEIN